MRLLRPRCRVIPAWLDSKTPSNSPHEALVACNAGSRSGCPVFGREANHHYTLPESVSSSSSVEVRPFFRITLRITLWTTDFVLVRSHRTPAWFHGAGSRFARANWREKTFATLPRDS